MQPTLKSRFQQVLEEAARGALAPTGLAAELATYRELLEQTRDEFEDSLGFHPPEARQACASQGARVREGFRVLSALCAELEGCAVGSALLEKWRMATVELNQALTAFREAALLNAGPTPLAGVNLVVAAHEQVIQGAASQQFLAGAIEAEHDRIGRVLDEPALEPELRRRFDRLRLVLEELAGQLPAPEECTVERLIDSAEAVVASWDGRRRREALGRGPTPSPRFNLLLSLAASGQTSEFLQEAEALAEDLRRIRQRFLSRREEVADPDLVERGAQALERCRDALRALTDRVQSGAPWEAQRLEIEQAFFDLEAVGHGIEGALGRVDRKVCTRCGRLHPATAAVCDCGAALPGFAGDGARGPELWGHGTAEHLARLVELVHQLEEGRCEPECLHRAVEALLRRAEQARKLLKREPNREFEAGLEQWERALHRLLEIHAPGQRTQLSLALDGLAEGAARMRNAPYEPRRSR